MFRSWISIRLCAQMQRKKGSTIAAHHGTPYHVPIAAFKHYFSHRRVANQIFPVHFIAHRQGARRCQGHGCQYACRLPKVRGSAIDAAVFEALLAEVVKGNDDQGAKHTGGEFAHS